MTWIAVEITLNVYVAIDQCRSTICTDYYRNCEDLHGTATTYACYLEHAFFTSVVLNWFCLGTQIEPGGLSQDPIFAVRKIIAKIQSGKLFLMLY
jgi:hypothetical protein